MPSSGRDGDRKRVVDRGVPLAQGETGIGLVAAGVSGVRARRRWVAAGLAPDDGSGAPDAIVAA